MCVRSTSQLHKLRRRFSRDVETAHLLDNKRVTDVCLWKKLFPLNMLGTQYCVLWAELNFPALPLVVAGKNRTIVAVRPSRQRGLRLVSNGNGGERTAACRQTQRSACVTSNSDVDQEHRTFV